MKWLDKSLGSIMNSSVDADLFIVDNGSTDGSIKFIQENFPNAKLTISKENLGFGKANNLGLQYALDNNYDFVYLLNQDAWVESDTFEKLIKFSQQNPEFGILSPLQTNKEKTRLDHNFSKCCGANILSDYLCQQPIKDIYSVDAVMAAHWFLPISTIKIVGGFSPTFRHYGEDLDYINRLHYFNLSVGVTSHTIGVHDREFRNDDIKKKQYIFHMENIVTLSNPNCKMHILHIMNSYIQAFFKNREKLNFKYIIRLIGNAHTISKNRTLSMNKGAFL